MKIVFVLIMLLHKAICSYNYKQTLALIHTYAQFIDIVVVNIMPYWWGARHGAYVSYCSLFFFGQAQHLYCVRNRSRVCNSSSTEIKSVIKIDWCHRQWKKGIVVRSFIVLCRIAYFFFAEFHYLQKLVKILLICAILSVGFNYTHFSKSKTCPKKNVMK